MTINGFPIPICHYSRSRCKSFRHISDYGYCAAKDERYYGFKEVIIISLDGIVNSWTVINPKVDERVGLWSIIHNVKGLLIGDKGFIGEELADELRTINIDLKTNKRSNMQESRPECILKFIKQSEKSLLFRVI